MELLTRSNRRHLAGTIGKRICDAEYGAWAREFGDDVSVELGARLCRGREPCTIQLSRGVANSA